MDRLFDRLGEMLRGLAAGKADRARGPAPDPFLREAEQELDEYLRSGRSGTGVGGRGRTPSSAPESLRRDFANLDLPPTARLEEARRAHHRLLGKYHPDRYARDPEKQRLATQITQRLNASFRRIQDFARRSAAD
jgi:DnaJ-domain-containing protein 1